MKSKNRPVVIVGAGIGGLSTAIRLATAGERVVVFEQNERVGGKMGELRAEGFRWDTGPSVITMRAVFEELFTSAGRRLEDYLTLQPLEPSTRYFYPDGAQLDLTRDWSALAAQIEQIEPRDVEGYLRFLAFASRIHRLTGPVFIYNQAPSWRTLLRVSPWQLLQVAPWLTMDQAIRRYVRSPQLRQLLGRFATYVGASPYQAPATLCVIAHVELTGGVWYPRGGIYAIATALVRLADELGVEVRTQQPVAQITVKNGRASGIRLATGEHWEAAAVVANVDVHTVYQQLLPTSIATPARQQALALRESSCSGYVLLLGVEGQHPQLAHHNIFFSRDYRREFDDLFGRSLPPNEPTVYVSITAKSDPGHAPAGCENWFVLVNAPPLSPAFDWSSQEGMVRKRVLGVLRRFGFDLAGKLRYARAITPVEFARISGAWRGALYGLSSNQALNALRRPPNCASELPGLYFVGGTTHPGGGVPMVMLSGKVVAQLVIEGLGLT
jgi:phytoene desaturase